MTRVTKIRALIESADLKDGRRVVLRMIRLGARQRIYFYATKNFIVDFDGILVTQRHRVFRQNIMDAAQVKATEAQAATTIDELLVIFDRISQTIT